MRLLSNNDINQVVGARATMSGNFSFGPDGMIFGPNFVMTVTGTSTNTLGSFKAYSDKVIDGSTNTVLFDGTQSTFCYKGSLFQVKPIVDGHMYQYVGAC